MRPRRTAWLLAGACLLAPSVARAVPAFTDSCDDALRAQQIDGLISDLRAATDPDCRLGRIDTVGPRTTIDWHHHAATTTVLLAPRACLLEPTHTGRDLAAHIPETLAACPAALSALEAFLGTDHALAPLLADGWSPEHPPLLDPRILATFAWLTALVLLLLTARRAHFTPRHLILVTILFLAGLLARFAVPAAPANWYGAFLPHDGWGDQRFGAGAAVLQAAVRAILPWTVDTAYALNRLLGALLIPLTVQLARRLGASFPAAALAGLLVTFAPIPVRLSSSSSEHVLAATLALAAWATWLRTASDPTWLPRTLALTLAALAVLTRVDCLPQLLLIPLWTTLHTSLDPLPLRRRLRDAAVYLLSLTALALYAYFNIIVPSRHPGPDLHGIHQTIKHLLSQFYTVAVTPPHWLTPAALVLTLAGTITAIAHKQWRWPLTAFASLALIFIPLGRNLLHDGLTGARYFILLPPLLAILPLPLIIWLSPRRATLVLALAIPLELATSQPGWRHQTTFQAEYQFLRDNLSTREHADCTLWFVRPRQPTHEPDLDCCLSPDQSPLTLQFPTLRFAAIPALPTPDLPGCNLYYDGAICSLDPLLAREAPRATARILAACATMRRHRLHPFVTTTVPLTTITPRSTTPPVVSLERRDL